jgi:cephalosporin-C deacetylase-like acetyl esterase
MFFQSETGVRIRAQLLTPKKSSAARPLLIYLKRSIDSIHSSDVDELLPVMGRYTILMLNPRLTEVPMNPTDYADVERTSVWVGRTIAAMQVWDTLRAIEWAVNEEKISGPVSIYGKGEMGIVALYAGLFDERVQQVILNDAPDPIGKAPRC